MNLQVIPKVVVAEDTPVTPAVLNLGFSPELRAEGAFESTDFANGSVTSPKLHAGLISGRQTEMPGPQHWLWFENGGAARKCTLSEMTGVWPWYTFPESAFETAPAATNTTLEDQLMLRVNGQTRRVVLGAISLTDVINAGTYRAGSLTVDPKGRVTAVQAGGGTWSTDWGAVPAALNWLRYQHPLTRVPALVQAWLQCVSGVGDAGYEPGDVVSAHAWFSHNNRAQAFQVHVSAAELKVWRVVTDADLRMISPEGVRVTPVPAKWKLKVNLRL